MLLSKNFTLEEMLRSEIATRKNISEQFSPSEEVIENLALLCTNLLQPLRNIVKLPLRSVSGFRCQRVNTWVGGSPTSDHPMGMADDVELYIDGVENNLFLAKTLLTSGLQWKQLIFEFGTARNPAWLHMSYEKGYNKNEILVASKQGLKTVYKTLSLADALKYVSV